MKIPIARVIFVLCKCPGNVAGSLIYVFPIELTWHLNTLHVGPVLIIDVVSMNMTEFVPVFNGAFDVLMHIRVRQRIV